LIHLQFIQTGAVQYKQIQRTGRESGQAANNINSNTQRVEAGGRRQARKNERQARVEAGGRNQSPDKQSKSTTDQ